MTWCNTPFLSWIYTSNLGHTSSKHKWIQLRQIWKLQPNRSFALPWVSILSVTHILFSKTHHIWQFSTLSQDRIHSEAVCLHTIVHWTEPELPDSPSPFKKEKQQMAWPSHNHFRHPLPILGSHYSVRMNSMDDTNTSYSALEFNSSPW